MIEVKIEGAEQLVAKLNAMGERARQEIGKAVAQGGYAVEGEAKSRAPVKTGTLRRSISTKVTVDAGSAEARVGTRGLPYAHFQEYGLSGQVSVRQHMRMITQAWGRELKNPHAVTVRAHNRAVKYEGKTFLRGSLKDLAPRIQQLIRDAMKRVIG